MTSTRIPGRRLLNAPGPTGIPDEVLDAMHRQSMDLADPRVTDVIADCEAGLRWLCGTADATPFTYIANGHGAWEAVIENLVPPGGVVLVPGSGHFSDSWAAHVEALGRRALRTPWREGHPIDVDAVEQVLRADGLDEIVAVFAVQTDTASGITSDVDALRQAIDAAGHPALFVVDAVASLGALPLAMDAQRIDVLLGASQKGLMMPPGLAFVVANAAAQAVAARHPHPRHYWDWRLRAGPMPYHKFCGTAPLHLLFGLRAALGLLQQETLPAVHARHRRLAGAVHAAIEAWREGGVINFFCHVPAARSVSVTAVLVRQGAPGAVDPEELRTVARERFQVGVAGGLGPLAGRVFRIGHLGDLNEAEVLGALGGIEAAMHALGVPCGQGVSRAAAFLAAGDQGETVSTQSNR
jgi:alanine-glyoxylate transaminase/serine-glyoxylate transaminase/serine-pyruvate transaminase